MPKLYQTQATTLQWVVAVRAHRPAGLAHTFASHAGQFYNRDEFDALARQVHALYARSNADDAFTFRTRLDHRLCDRYHAPVAWELSGDTTTGPTVGASVGADGAPLAPVAWTDRAA